MGAALPEDNIYEYIFTWDFAVHIHIYYFSAFSLFDRLFAQKKCLFWYQICLLACNAYPNAVYSVPYYWYNYTRTYNPSTVSLDCKIVNCSNSTHNPSASHLSSHTSNLGTNGLLVITALLRCFNYWNIGARTFADICIIWAHLHFQLFLKMRFVEFRRTRQKVRQYGTLVTTVLMPITCPCTQ